ncbi:hypothetical protein EDD22DRAFT_932922 [Suillus occidentalis]|nr:hypothetical protein EDD22DRAFT_932922 [Suillus occidentalis]
MPLHLPFAVLLFVVYTTCSSAHDTTPMTIGRCPTPTSHPLPSSTSILSCLHFVCTFQVVIAHSTGSSQCSNCHDVGISASRARREEG